MTEPLPGHTTRKTALAPDPRTMDDRAARAWTERMAVRPLIRSVVTIYRYDRVTDAIDPEQTYNRPYE